MCGCAGQIIDRQVWTQLAQDMATCYKNGNLLLRAAGGGGGGLWAGSQQASPTDDDLNDDPTPVEAMAYGGGWGFSFTFASPTGSGTGPGPVVGSELGHVATNCHSQCAFQTSTGQFYTCFCPCLKQGFTKVCVPAYMHAARRCAQLMVALCVRARPPAATCLPQRLAACSSRCRGRPTSSATGSTSDHAHHY